MPVRKFRSVEEMEAGEHKWRAPDDPQLWAAISTVWDLASRICPRRFPPGVHKHRSIEAMNRQTEEWAREAGRPEPTPRCSDDEGP